MAPLQPSLRRARAWDFPHLELARRLLFEEHIAVGSGASGASAPWVGCGTLSGDHRTAPGDESLFVFGHVGLTIGAAYASRAAASRWRKHAVAFSMDFRLVVVGSMAPDLIDKPLGLWIAPDLVDNSLRSVAHTLVFAVSLLSLGLTIWALERGPKLALAAVSRAGHIVLDRTWRTASVLFWPFLGWDFGVTYPPVSEWASKLVFDALRFFTDFPELVGFVIIVAVAARLVYTKSTRRFLRGGVVS